MNALETTGKTFAFTFGDPEPILSTASITDYLGIFIDAAGDYYRPPVDQLGLVKLLGANAYHGTILHFKKNLLKKWFIPSPILSKSEFERLAFNYVVTGNAFIQVIRNGLGRPARLLSQPAVALRKMTDGRYLKLLQNGERIEFQPGEIIHLMEPDLRQSIYGVPEYLGGIQSLLLSEDSTLFRRKYYQNGAHMGYILVTHDADIDDDTAVAIEQQIKQAKGPGNFRSLYMNIGRSNSREPVKVIPVGDIGTKDEFERIKNITEREMLAMHRMQPGLSGIIPQNVSGFGDIEKVMRVYYELEVQPLQESFLELNRWVGREVVRFREPEWMMI